MTVYITGNSHVAAIANGAKLRAEPLKGVKLLPLGNGAAENRPFSVFSKGRVEFTDPTFATSTRRLAGGDPFARDNTWVFMIGTHTSLLFRDGFFKDARPLEMLAPGYRPVSQQLLDAMIDDNQFHVKRFIEHLLMANARFSIASCPPLRRDSASVRNCGAEDIARHVDSLARARFRSWLDAKGVAFIEPPPDACDADGFLLDELALKVTKSGLRDPHHANEIYGAKMMDRILESVGVLG